MSETVKLIIEIPQKEYELVKELKAINIGGRGSGKGIIYACLNAIKKGTPLDDVKAEINQFRESLAEKAPSLKDLVNAQRTVDICLGIIDNIGKGDKE